MTPFSKDQRELTDVLLHFRRNPVALMCDIAENWGRLQRSFISAFLVENIESRESTWRVRVQLSCFWSLTLHRFKPNLLPYACRKTQRWVSNGHRDSCEEIIYCYSVILFSLIKIWKTDVEILYSLLLTSLSRKQPVDLLSVNLFVKS